MRGYDKVEKKQWGVRGSVKKYILLTPKGSIINLVLYCSLGTLSYIEKMNLSKKCRLRLRHFFTSIGQVIA